MGIAPKKVSLFGLLALAVCAVEADKHHDLQLSARSAYAQWLKPASEEECKQLRLAVVPQDIGTFGFGASLYFLSLHLWLARVTGRKPVMSTFPLTGYTNHHLC